MKFLKLLLITWSLSLNAGLPPLPSPAGNAGKFLTNDGTKMSWGSVSGTIVAAPGTVLTLAAATCPTGTLLADGSAISRTTYSDLFASIGTTHGSGDGTTTFNLPDYRGRFLRGVDGTANRDPDKASRTAMATGGNTGNNVGSVQSGQLQSHTHNYGGNLKQGTVNFNGTFAGWIGSGVDDIQNTGVTATGGNETRPINANVIYCVVTTSLATATASYTPGRQVFTSSGTFTIPSGVTVIKVTAVGGGGGGGGANTQNSAGGGGGGGTAIKLLTGLTPGNTLTVSVGSAGAGGSVSGSNGSTGGTSQVSSGTQTITTIQALGGSGGSRDLSAANTGGSGGFGGGADLIITGGSGGTGASGFSGKGGDSTLGFGAYSAVAAAGGGAGEVGKIGSGYGAGGSGAAGTSLNNWAGGAGTAGVVIIEW